MSDFCESCGKPVSPDFRLCPYCGAELAAEPLRQERKVVTVLFCDLVGFTSRAEAMDPEDVRALLAPYHEHVRGELERYGGTVGGEPLATSDVVNTAARQAEQLIAASA
jgi:class 3 adenylate cyclase